MTVFLKSSHTNKNVQTIEIGIYSRQMQIKKHARQELQPNNGPLQTGAKKKKELIESGLVPYTHPGSDYFLQNNALYKLDYGLVKYLNIKNIYYVNNKDIIEFCQHA